MDDVPHARYVPIRWQLSHRVIRYYAEHCSIIPFIKSTHTYTPAPARLKYRKMGPSAPGRAAGGNADGGNNATACDGGLVAVVTGANAATAWYSSAPVTTDDVVRGLGLLARDAIHCDGLRAAGAAPSTSPDAFPAVRADCGDCTRLSNAADGPGDSAAAPLAV